MAVTIQKSKGEGTVTTKKSTGVELHAQSETNPVMTDGALVGFKIGHTKNLGNYESIRFEVSLTLPTTVDKLDEAYDACKTWADKKLTEAVEEVEQETS